MAVNRPSAPPPGIAPVSIPRVDSEPKPVDAITPGGTNWQPALELGLLGALLFATLFASPRVPTHLTDWPALRTEMFFQGLAATNPVAGSDGLLAFLLRPTFGTAHVLVHVVWELYVAAFLTLLVLSSLAGLPRRPRYLLMLLFAAVSLTLREATFWAAALIVTFPRRSSTRWDEYGFVTGVILGIFGLLDFYFWLWSVAVVILQLTISPRSTRIALASAAGWLLTTLTGWNLIPGGLTKLAGFISRGFVQIASISTVSLIGAALLCLYAFWRAQLSWKQSAVSLVLAFALCSVSVQPDLGSLVSSNFRDIIHGHLEVWNVLIHPERFERRVLNPAWKKLASEHPLPAVVEQIGLHPVDVIGADQLIALANGLRHLPGSHLTGDAAVLAASGSATAKEAKLHSRNALLTENDFTLWLSSKPGAGGFSPWPLWKLAPYNYLPVFIESPLPPVPDLDQNHRIAAFTLPLHLVYGPIPYATEQVTGQYYAEGGNSRLLAYHRLADGTRKLLMERGLNPDLKEQERELQNFTLDIPNNSTGWIEFLAEPVAGTTSPCKVRLVSMDFRRDLNRTITTILTPRSLHDNSGFMSFPVVIASATEAAPIRTETNQQLVMVHMPAIVSFAKPKEVTRLTGTYGFMPGAYAHPEAGTNGAVVSVWWLSGNDAVRQIFSRTLKPKTDPSDQGPQHFDLDLSELGDGILVINMLPAVAKDISWGWTYLGEIDLQTANEKRPNAERFAEINLAYDAAFRPAPSLIKTNEQKPKFIQSGDARLLRLHAPAEAMIGVTAGHTQATGQFGFADEAWKTKGLTDGADFVVLWRDYHGDVELFRRHLDPAGNPADRGPFQFSVDLTDRGNGLLVLRTGPGPSGNNYWDWTGWSDITVR